MSNIKRKWTFNIILLKYNRSVDYFIIKLDGKALCLLFSDNMLNILPVSDIIKYEIKIPITDGSSVIKCKISLEISINRWTCVS